MDGDRTKISLTEDFKTVIEHDHELLDSIGDEVINEHALYDPQRKASPSRCTMGNQFVWWWYSDDPELDPSNKPLKPTTDFNPMSTYSGAIRINHVVEPDE